MRQASVDMADDGIAEVHQSLGDASLGHRVARECIERNREKRPGIHSLKHTLADSYDSAGAADDQDAAHGGQAKRDSDRHAENHHYNKAS